MSEEKEKEEKKGIKLKVDEVKAKRRLTDRDIARALERIPPLSPVVVNVINLLNDPTSSAQRIAEELGKDPVLSFEVLRIVNSPFYGLSRQVSSLEHAVALLGTKTLESIVFSAYAKMTYDTELKSFKLKRGELSIQSFIGAFVAKSIAEDHWSDVEDISFTAGVLRNIGKIAMDYFIEREKDLVQLELKKTQTFDKIEKKIFGISSDEISAMILEKWKIPEIIRKVIATYNSKISSIKDKRSPVYRAAVCVHIGDRIAMMTGLGAGIDSLIYSIDKSIFRDTKIKESDVEEYFERVIEIYPLLLKELKGLPIP